MNHILFVDDDENILNGLRRRLHGMRPDWEMAFATSAAQAMEMANTMPLDVIITDMRMPGMDGASLLGALQKSHPHITRIILSGFAEEEAVLRTVGPAHQYLAKPCEDSLLVETIENALDLRQLLAGDELRSLVASIETLASPPDTYLRLVKALEDPKVSQEMISQIVSSDIALTAEVLKLTNSAYFAIAQKISSVSHAVRMIGTETLKALALFIGIFRGFDGPPSEADKLLRLCHRSQQIGVTAAMIAEYEQLPRAICQAVPSTGMLSHVGSLILYANRNQEMAEVIKRVETEHIPIEQAELEQFGAAHPEVGAYLLGLWGFPAPVVQAVAYHHRPMDQPHREMNVLTSIYVAQHLTREVGQKESGIDAPSQIDLDYLASIGKADSLGEWENIARIVADKYKSLTQ
ncbi:response regulator [Thalassospira alkalitolerans]|uniref:Response regulator n=1 Tax=Thalassospira alkalitolerans TaxID=1293890 RepID=A0A1Y2LDZ4_9PROT|nr:response regulator [Thalassospira alkalitolerans]OSQ49130.1 response regulator [Thalassospira alkalitolerans]|tara:strand:+ start:33322 stop:34542 length:1221 start_codon:yes stop_codon:yes gene_type:complete